MTQQNIAVTVRFPLGQFNASDNAGVAEYPPSPARVAAALLAVSYGAEDTAEIEAARVLFDTIPPVIDAPRATVIERMERWVPVQYNERAKKANLMPKDAENGVMLDPDLPVTFYWEGFEGNVEALANAARRIGYVGRPTSPAIVSVSAASAPEKPLEGVYRWFPDANGTSIVNVPSTDYLRSLDNREAERGALNNPGYHPVVRRTQAHYLEPSFYTPEDGNAPVAPEWSVVNAFLAEAVSYRLKDCALGYAGGALEMIADATGGDVIPLLRSEEFGGDLMYGALVINATFSLTSIPVFSGRGVTEAKVVGKHSAAEKKAAITAMSSARVWTTVVPVDADIHLSTTAAQEVASMYGAEVEAMLGHNTPRDSSFPSYPERDDVNHLSIRFDRPVAGPLFIRVGETTSVMVPVDLTKDTNQ